MESHYTTPVRDILRTAGDLSRRSGRSGLDTDALLYGIAATEGCAGQRALQLLGASYEAIAAQLRTSSETPTVGDVKLTVAGHAAVEFAIRATNGHEPVNTGYLLLGVARTDGPGRHLLERLGVTPEAVTNALRAVTTAGAPAELSTSPSRAAVIGDLKGMDPGPEPTVPGWLARALARLASVTVVVGFVAALTAATWDTAGPELILALPAIFLPVNLLVMSRFGTAPRLARTLARFPDPVDTPDWLAALLDRHVGGTSSMRIGPARLADHVITLGRRRWILLSRDTVEEPTTGRFVLAHEIAHIVYRHARHLLMARRLWLALPLSVLASGTAWWPLAWLAGLLLHQTAIRWIQEFVADWYAARWVGTDAALAFLRRGRAAIGPWRRHPIRRRIALARGLLTHPPLSWRIRRLERRATSAVRSQAGTRPAPAATDAGTPPTTPEGSAMMTV